MKHFLTSTEMRDDPYIGHRSAPKHKVVTEAQEKSKRQSSECTLQTKICSRINDIYPGTLFVSDFAAGLYLPDWIAITRSKQACIDKWLDLTILEPRGKFHALIIEIKTLQGTPYLVDGKTLKKSDHIEAQYKTICKLKAMDYAACFGVGEDNIWSIIERYKGLPLWV